MKGATSLPDRRQVKSHIDFRNSCAKISFVYSDLQKGDLFMKQKVLSLLVDNNSGVLSRVSGMFSRRGYNIDSLTVGETENPKLSRMTIAVTGDDRIISQIRSQLEKLEDVIEVTLLEEGLSVSRQLVLVKVECDSVERQQVIAIANVFRANIVDVSPESVIIEITGSTNKVDACINLLSGFRIKQLVRTGLTGLVRG